MMELEVELLVKLLFIFGLLFLLWVGQAVVIRFVCTSKEELSIIAFTLGVLIYSMYGSQID